MAIVASKKQWDVSVFYMLPVDDESQECGIGWEKYEEDCRVSVPADLDDGESVLMYIEICCPGGVNFLSASPVSAQPNS